MRVNICQDCIEDRCYMDDEMCRCPDDECAHFDDDPYAGEHE